MLFLSPPFSNYLRLPMFTRIRGSYTLEPRPGLINRLRTIRYSRLYGGYINKIGFRNKGLIYGLKKCNSSDILSIGIMNSIDNDKILSILPENQNIELNISCPNVDKKDVYNGLDKYINSNRRWCIIKLSPSTTIDEVRLLYNIGFRQFHCCNTMFSEYGGISGQILRPFVNMKICLLRNYDNIEIIAGGGIRSYEDIKKYKELGAHHFSISTICFNPFLLCKLVFWCWWYN